MKVKELIELLSKINPEYEVMILGDEGAGVCGILSISEPEEFLLNYNNDQWSGPHERLVDANASKPNQKVTGVILYRDYSQRS
jgi:hypothetical protein